MLSWDHERLIITWRGAVVSRLVVLLKAVVADVLTIRGLVKPSIIQLISTRKIHQSRRSDISNISPISVICHKVSPNVMRGRPL